MKTAAIIVASVTAFLLLCQLMCGSWIRRKGADEAGKKFHARLGILNVVMGLATSALSIIVSAG